MSWRRLYTDLLVRLPPVASGDQTMPLLKSLQAWMAASRELGDEVRHRYGLDEYEVLDLNRYPLIDASLDFAEEVRRVRAEPPTSSDSLAMCVRDIFWWGITADSDVDCPRCDAATLRVLHDPGSNQLVLACDLCTWAQTIDGKAWEGTSLLAPATTDQLARSPFKPGSSATDRER